MFNSQYKPILISFLLFTLLSIFSGNFCCAQDSTDAEKMHLQGHVKSLRAIEYWFPGKLNQYTKQPIEIIEDKVLFFNRDGNVTKELRYYTDKTIMDETRYRYRGRFKVREICRRYGKEIYYKYYYKRYQSQKAIKVKRYNKDGFYEKSWEYYDDNWALKNIIYHEKDGSNYYWNYSRYSNVDSLLTIGFPKKSQENVNGFLDYYITHFKYNNAAFVIKEKEGNYYPTYKYFNNGRLIEERQVDNTDNLIYRRIYCYDSLGNIIAANVYSAFYKQNEQCEYSFDMRGNKTMSSRSFSNSDYDVVQYPYDFIPDYIYGVQTSADWKYDYSSWEYEYDSYGNVTAQYQYFSKPKKELDRITSLAIKYY